jgi:hypothetical protein
MTFSPDFAFYRDDRPIGSVPDADFWTAMKQEARDMLNQRSLTYPGLVAKSRMSRADCDRELRVARAIAEDWAAVEASPGFPIATWSEMIHCLRREISLRRKFWPPRVEAKQIDGAEADRRILLLEQWHDLLWHSGHRDAVAARAAVALVLPKAA